jgi:hypothetical protein
MKKRYVIGLMAALLVLAGCGAGTSSSEEGVLLSGVIDSSSTTSLSKSNNAGGESGECIEELCGITAYGADGSEVQGEIDPATMRWRIRVRAGEWMFRCRNRNGERAGNIPINGETMFTIEEREDEVDVGTFRYNNGCLEQVGDMADLGCYGIYPREYLDLDFDGMPADIDDAEPEYDESVFSILSIRPPDGVLHVSPCRPIRIAFNRALDEASVTDATVIVTNADGEVVAGTLRVTVDDEREKYEIVFEPDGGFALEAVISLTVVSGDLGVLSVDGEALTQDAVISFTVTSFQVEDRACYDPHEEQRRHCMPPPRDESGGWGGLQ